jgi:hypothetical protein
MFKPVKRYLLFKYVAREPTRLSKPFETNEEADKAREKYAERLRNTVGLGLIRTKK